MIDETTNMVIEWMRRLDEQVTALSKELASNTQELRGLRLIMLSDMQHREIDVTTLAGIQTRLDRIERRLELTP